jgi:hypothetical protein
VLLAAGQSRNSSANIAEIYNQVLMMLGHEIFDPEIGKRVLVDHAFIVSGGEITKPARNWLGTKLDVSRRSQILFIDRDDILNLYLVSGLPVPERTLKLSGNTLATHQNAGVWRGAGWQVCVPGAQTVQFRVHGRVQRGVAAVYGWCQPGVRSLIS